MHYQSFSLSGPWGANPLAEVHQKGRWPGGLRDLPSCKISSLYANSRPRYSLPKYPADRKQTEKQTVNDISTTCLSACVDNKTTHLTLGVLLHYLAKLKIQISGRLSTVPMSHNVFSSLLTPCFVQRFSGNLFVNLFAVYPLKYKLFIKNLSLLLNTMLIVDKHCSDVCCDEFPVPQLIARVNK